ncbi:ATP-binding protein [Massilia sp. CF038]|uniref:ATP-binding protein n=1 Tax=Massilia sp. CF038 TaxID=1881045 RepID=UPI00091C4F87|nr:ATP-binding protein [Massilia sp. CF038]SHG62169.1 two-component system, sensor histidine kinase RegB [Massilia sp. CF038]
MQRTIGQAAWQQAPRPTATARHAAGYRNMQYLIELRWIAVAGQITTIATVTLGFGVQLPLAPMLQVLACLIAFNLFSHLRWQEERTVTNGQVFLALLMDVASLTAQLYLSGGMSNPFVFLYLLQVILSAILLRRWTTWIVVGIVGLCLAILALFAEPLALPQDYQNGLSSLYIQGILISVVLNAVLLAIFITRISRNLRAGDAQLATLRQRAVEEEHIVRMGLLASGAAHELGTPLSTMAVILGDWRRMPEFTNNPELLAEIGEMQAQLARCKTIVSGILMSAGEARGEASGRTSIKYFLDQLVAEWRDGRHIGTFHYENRIGRDVAVVSDSTFKQMIWNVLENALEASPQWISVVATETDGIVTLEVRDRGPGFAPDMLAHFGTPYQSTKGRPGGGLGLFLVVNVARTLGGTVEARNLAEGGAAVRVSLPLAAIAVEIGDDDVG